MLTLLLILAMSSQGQSLVDSGLDFITAFPENVAYFYPFFPKNSLNITALYDNTEVNIYFKGILEHTVILQQGQTEVYLPPSDVEEHKLDVSQKTIQVVSNNYVVVLSISKQEDSVQTNVVYPYTNLGTFYSIPQLNYSEMLSKFPQATGSIKARYSFFRLLIINAQNFTNYIEIVRISQQIEQFQLQPYTLLQLALDGSEVSVESLYNMAVIVSHPCLEATSCKCNMMLNQLRPDAHWGQSFILPLLNIPTWLHITVNTILTGNTLDAGTLEPIQSGTQSISTIYPASLRLISPGLILEVIPETMFAACYLVHFSVAYGNVLVIAETLSRSEVYIDRSFLSSNSWTAIANTKYSIVSVLLHGRHVIWHPTSKIAVYMFRNMTGGIQYGGPAVVLGEKPDPDGCSLHPPEITVAPTPMSWPESHQYCTSTSDELISPSTVIARSALTEFLRNAANTEHWIGLRRSLLTLDWYWQKGNESEDLMDTQWGAGEPSDPVQGMCASVFSDLTWKSVRCCTELKAICYKKPDYFPVLEL
ncbi:hypothetical protein IRJ41_017009 [Triplophysa rosa]|uniref:C-type lectin domain-containing protein n=1 Tax=Triplophysa rosa TaxID=992332 RepID=A0A9W7WRG1_TRIRA|nr:hypothetical protein IRJ41_017009 [Triplophysa rosa]